MLLSVLVPNPNPPSHSASQGSISPYTVIMYTTTPLSEIRPRIQLIRHLVIAFSITHPTTVQPLSTMITPLEHGDPLQFSCTLRLAVQSIRCTLTKHPSSPFLSVHQKRRARRHQPTSQLMKPHESHCAASLNICTTSVLRHGASSLTHPAPLFWAAMTPHSLLQLL